MTNHSAATTLLFPACMALALLFSASAVAEQIFTVDSTLDQIDDDVSDGVCRTAAGTCTLRAAIMQANRTTGVGATIRLPAGTYTLSRPRTPSGGERDGDLDLTTPASGNPVIRIVGAGQETTIIDAAQIDRVLSVAKNRAAVISGVTIRNGYTMESGGGIYNEGTLLLDAVALSGNRSGGWGGGAIFNSYAPLTVQNSSLISNFTTGSGGAIRSQSSSVYVQGSTIAVNVADGNGGGMHGSGMYDYANITNSVITDNEAGQNGGGLNSHTLRMSGTTVARNHALDGAGIFSEVEAIVVNSTIAQNQAAWGGHGAGIRAVSAKIHSSTIAYNRLDPAAGAGGGIYVAGSTPAELRNSLVARNSGFGSDDCAGSISSYGQNFFGTTAYCTITNQSGGAWGLLSSGSLGALGDHGGPTPTVELLAGSNAIDAATLDGGCRDDLGALPADQRGFQRVGACDVGAFEYGAIDPDRIFRSGFE